MMQRDSAKQGLIRATDELGSLRALAQSGDPAMETALEGWLKRAHALAGWVERIPEKRIPMRSG